MFHSYGKVDSFVDQFITFLKGRANTFGLPLRIFAGIWFPAVLLVLRLSKIFLITSSETFDNLKLLDTLNEVLS